MEAALAQAGIGPERIELIMLGSRSQNELDAVRQTFGAVAETVVTVSTARGLGEMFAAGPILNTAVGLKVPDWAALPRYMCSRPPQRGGSPMAQSQQGCILVNGISYEGMCASMIIAKTDGETA
jgi:hypothetical protein